MSDIADLTDYQIHTLYFRARDKQGIPKPMPAPKQKKKKVKIDIKKAYQEYMMASLALGMNPEVIQKNWENQHGRI
jgi:hypothetical protein